MSTTNKSQTISFPSRIKDSNGHVANAFSFGPNLNEGSLENLFEVLRAILTETRAFIQRTSDRTRKNVEVSEELYIALQSGASQIGERIVENTWANTEQFLKAFKDMASIHRIEDLAKLQNDLFQKQLSLSTEQAKEILTLSHQIFQKTFDAFLIASQRSMENRT